MRKLATIRQISDIQPIPEADKICTYFIDGWTIVDQVGKYTINELVIMCEIDSWIPHGLAPFLSKGQEPREFEGVKGERLKTIRLKKQLSQGLILSQTDCFGANIFTEGTDVTEKLGVLKYEKPVNAQLAGMARGNFPSFIPKTDQERIQNLKKELTKYNEESYRFEVTEKVDGSSCTVYRNSRLIEEGKDPIGVCSRNLDLKETEGNSFWSVARSAGVIEALESYGGNIAIQGELAGPGVQGNQYKLPKLMFFVFDIFDINTQRYYDAFERDAFCHIFKLTVAPVIDKNFMLLDATVESLLTMAEGESKLNAQYGSGQSTREGLVFKCLSDPSISFKAISNKWLLKYEE